MTARSKARKRALDVLYAAEARGVDPLVVLDERMEVPTGPDRHSWTPIGDYAEGLVRGVVEHQDRIDGLLAEHSRGSHTRARRNGFTRPAAASIPGDCGLSRRGRPRRRRHL